MAKITRKLQKIFAVNSASDQTTAFGSIKANSPEAPVYTKDPDAIQTTAYTNGWGDATQDDYAPYRQDMNSLQFLITRQLAYLFQAGIPEYDASTEYYANSSYCLYGGIIYKCIQDCVNKTPSNEPTYWTGYDLGTFAKINSPIFTGNPQAPTVNLADSSASIATTAFVKGNLGATSVVATGTIIPFGSASVPSGYLACDGSAISRSTYSALFSVIGTTWGTGDGSTTFNLPNFTGGSIPLNNKAPVYGNNQSFYIKVYNKNGTIRKAVISAGTWLEGADKGTDGLYVGNITGTAVFGTNAPYLDNQVKDTATFAIDDERSCMNAHLLSISPTWIIKY